VVPRARLPRRAGRRAGGADRPGHVTSTRPRKQEQEPATTEVVELAPGILRTQLPIQLPGLGHVNMYLLQDDRGVAVVDPGLPGPRSWRALVDRLKRAGHRPADVHTVVVTHSHPDHFGGAGKLRDDFGAEVLTHRSFRTWFDPAEDDAVGDDPPTAGSAEPQPAPWAVELPWREGATMQVPLKRRLRRKVMTTLAKRYVRTPRPTTRVDDAEVVQLAGREWVSLHTPGHTPDHLCLFDPAEGVMLSGDHVLPTITPHISGLHAGPDPLSAFFGSLDKVAALGEVRLVLPAHGHPFHDLPGRAADIKVHHEERLEKLRTVFGDLGRPAGVEELSRSIFRQRSWGPMAESETYAHLEHLRLTGQVESRQERGSLLYALSE
jgi:glyoxylase-like metal-dependent hydrolase (beta-lactamase superfamily II)